MPKKYSTRCLQIPNYIHAPAWSAIALRRPNFCALRYRRGNILSRVDKRKRPTLALKGTKSALGEKNCASGEVREVALPEEKRSRTARVLRVPRLLSQSDPARPPDERPRRRRGTEAARFSSRASGKRGGGRQKEKERRRGAKTSAPGDDETGRNCRERKVQFGAGALGDPGRAPPLEAREECSTGDPAAAYFSPRVFWRDRSPGSTGWRKSFLQKNLTTNSAREKIFNFKRTWTWLD